MNDRTTLDPGIVDLDDCIDPDAHPAFTPRRRSGLLAAVLLLGAFVVVLVAVLR